MWDERAPRHHNRGMTSRTELDHLFATQTVVASRDCVPRQRRMLSRLLAEGAIARVLPGVYARAAVARQSEVRCAAVRRWDPDAVIGGLAAAKLSFSPRARVTSIDVMSQRKRRGPRWLSLSRSRIPPEHVATDGDGLRITRAAWTAVAQAARDDGDAIDNALRERVATLTDLKQAVIDQCGRRGTPTRRAVVRDSRSKPWSQGERRLHRELRSAGIKGWVANHWVTLSNGSAALDVAFPGLPLYLEFDGKWSHDNPEAFEKDRVRQNQLYTELGLVAVRITWAMLADPALLIRTIKRAIRRAKVSLRRSAARR